MLPATSIEAYDRTRDFRDKSFRAGCYAPYVSLYFNTVGDVVACCKNQTFVLGNVRQESLDAIWKGARIRTLRKALAGYRFEAGCGHCEWQIRGGDYQGAYPRVFEEFPVAAEAPEWPAMMEFVLSNTCNFECVMCYGELSSSIRARRENLPPLPKAYDERFFADLGKYLPHLRRAKFLGGEPFLAAESFRVWDLMIEGGLSIPCHVTTNGSIWNARVERVLERLPVSISVSLDGATKETFERVRVNGNFDEVVANVRRFAAYARSRGTEFTLAFCLMRENWGEFADVLLFAEEIGCDAFVNTVIEPASQSLFTLPPEELRSIADRMEEGGKEAVRRLGRTRPVWENEIRNLRDNADPSRRSELAGLVEGATEARRTIEGPASDHVSPAWELVGQGKLREALVEVHRTTEANPSYWQALVLRGYLRRRLGELEAAETELESARRIAARRPEVHAQVAWLRIDQGRVAEAIAAARHALSLVRPGEPAEAGVQDALGAALCLAGDWEEARRAYDRLLELRPSDPEVRVHRGWAYDRAGLSRESLAEAEAALALDAAHGEAQRLRATALSKLR